MSFRVVGEPTPDAALPALGLALDQDYIQPHILAVAEAERFERPNLVAEILAHKHGRRATIHFAVQDGRDTAQQVDLVVKAYRSPVEAERAYAVADGLATKVLADSPELSCPSPLLLLTDDCLVVQRYVRGDELRTALGAPDAAAALSTAARWLSVLHHADPLPGLRPRSAATELRKMSGWCDEIGSEGFDDIIDEVADIRTWLHAMELPEPPRRMIHRDFYYANVIWDGTMCSAVDLDQVCLGDPALDVGHFVAHLDFLAIRNARTEGRRPHQGDVFVDAYRRYVSRDAAERVTERLELYKAYTYLKLAATEVRRRRRAWRRHASSLALLAHRSLMAMTESPKTSIS